MILWSQGAGCSLKLLEQRARLEAGARGPGSLAEGNNM